MRSNILEAKTTVGFYSKLYLQQHNTYYPSTRYVEIYTTVGELSENIDKIEEYKNHIYYLNNYRKVW